MRVFLLVILFMINVSAMASDVSRIDIGKDYNKYSDRELRERLWKLEQAVWQLQQRVSELEARNANNYDVDSWVCTISAMGNNFTASGPSKAVAINRVTDECKRKHTDGFFCKNPVCEK